jgi:uncharacterized protein YbaP (TraB family)
MAMIEGFKGKLKLIGAAAALALAGCAAQPAAETAGSAAAGAPRPAMWKVSDADTTMYLFGTIHLLPEGRTWRTAAFDSALASADELVLEIGDVGDPAAMAQSMMKMGLSPTPLPPLRERVPEAKRAALDAIIKESGIPAAALDRFETWAAGLSLLGVTFQRLGLNPEFGVEKTIGAAWKDSGKPTIGLETAEEQFGFFDGMPETEQRVFLEGVLDSPEEAKKQFAEMLDAWSRGDEAAIARTFEDEQNMTPALREVLLTRRNARWAEWMDARMKRPGTVFVAVGAGHLAGKDSVQDFLKKKGHRAKRVQ